MSRNDHRAATIEALRELATVLEKNPDVAAPLVVGWCPFSGGSEFERFTRLHDIAEALGIQVVEEENGDRKLDGRLGPLLISGRAMAERRAKDPVGPPPVVERPRLADADGAVTR